VTNFALRSRYLTAATIFRGAVSSREVSIFCVDGLYPCITSRLRLRSGPLRTHNSYLDSRFIQFTVGELQRKNAAQFVEYAIL
jgi:hypothetical protein